MEGPWGKKLEVRVARADERGEQEPGTGACDPNCPCSGFRCPKFQQNFAVIGIAVPALSDAADLGRNLGLWPPWSRPRGGRDWTVVHTYPGSRQGLRWSCLITDSVFSAFLYSSRRCLWSQVKRVYRSGGGGGGGKFIHS